MKQLVTTQLNSVAASDAIATNQAPFLPGDTVVADIYSSAVSNFNGTAQWQTSDDGTTWANVGTAMTAGALHAQEIVLRNYVRLNCTAYTAGAVKGRLINSID